MKIKIRGARGSIPTADPFTVRYGGNTSCAELSAEGWRLILDAGSGLRYCNPSELPSNRRIDILLTHLHLDHILGLGFFNPIYDPEMEIHIWGPASSMQSLRSRLSRYLSPPLFPVLIRNLPSKLSLHEIGNSNFEIGPFQIRSEYVIHPGPTVGYRVTQGRSVFTYIPDHEPALGCRELSQDKKWVSGIFLAEGADLLLHDAQYTAAEYPLKTGWGHSSVDDVLSFASLAGVKHLLLAHHDPDHTDTQLDDIYQDLRLRNNPAFRFEPAVEGMEFELS
ncbi:MAG: MBL fold metallo-hydrolase [Chitinophagaceae bacterium]